MSTLQFYEIDGYPRESKTVSGYGATRQLLCRWEDRYALRAALVAHPPAVYPYFVPGGSLDLALRVVDVEIEPLGQSTQVTVPGFQDALEYAWAVLTVTYATPEIGDSVPYPTSADPIKHEDPQAALSETLEPFSEALRLDPGLFQWSDGTELQPNEAPVRPVYRFSYVLTRHNQDSVPDPVKTGIGKINAGPVSPVLLPGLIFETHGLLYAGCTINLGAGDEGESLIDVTYRFLYKEEGWRKYWRADAEAYQTVQKVADGTDYESPEEMDFSVFFP